MTNQAGQSGSLGPDGLRQLFGAAMTGSDEAAVQTHPALIAARQQGYEPMERVGDGGVAEVWRAVDQNTGRDVVLKVARRSGDDDVEQEQKRWRVLKQEGEVLGRVNVPGVVPLLRRGGVGPGRFLVFPLIEGLPLSDYAVGAKPAELVVVLQRVLRIVADLHDQGIAHGDLKPGNILVSARHDVVLIDLGFATQLDETVNASLRQDLRGGTPGFVPEDADAWRARGLDGYALAQTLRVATEGRPHRALHARVKTLTKTWPAGRAVVTPDYLRQTADVLVESAWTPKTFRRRAARVVSLIVLAGLLAAAGYGGYRYANVPGAPTHQWAESDSAAATDRERLDAAWTALEAMPVSERGWLWRVLGTQREGELIVRHGEALLTPATARVVGSHGGRAEADANGRVAVLTAEGSRWERKVTEAGIDHLAWSLDGRVLLVVEAERLVLLDGATGEELIRHALPAGPVEQVSMAGYPNLRLVEGAGTLREFNLMTGEHAVMSEATGVWLPVSHSESWLELRSNAGQKQLVLTDASGWERAFVAMDGVPTVTGFDLHEASGQWAVGWDDGRVWSMDTSRGARETTKLPDSESIRSVAYGPAGRALLLVGDTIWALDTRRIGAEPVILSEPLPGAVEGVAWVWELDGFRIATQAGVTTVSPGVWER